MFKMNFQITNKPVYQPPIIKIYKQTQSSLVISNPIVFGSIFGAMIPKGPCPSCR